MPQEPNISGVFREILKQMDLRQRMDKMQVLSMQMIDDIHNNGDDVSHAALILVTDKGNPWFVTSGMDRKEKLEVFRKIVSTLEGAGYDQ